MRSVLDLDETPPAIEQPLFNVATKLKHDLLTNTEMESILLLKLSSLAEDIHVTRGEASQETNLHTQNFFRD